MNQKLGEVEELNSKGNDENAISMATRRSSQMIKIQCCQLLLIYLFLVRLLQKGIKSSKKRCHTSIRHRDQLIQLIALAFHVVG